MERVGQTGNVLLRYSVAQRSFENEASSSALEHRPAAVKNSDDDVDFNDVFGGPPTRARYSLGGGRIKSSEESTSCPPGLGERPVFGESYSSPRRRPSDDFYDDIFRKSNESVRSPRWSSTMPGSRTLSPAHSKIEPFATSIPAQFSLPAKMTKAMDIPVFGSSSSSPHRYKEGPSNKHTPNTSLSRFSSPAMQEWDDFRNSPGRSPGQTLLSHEPSGAEESPYSTRSTEDEIGHKAKHKTSRTASPSSEFHFSIYKWASIGVPLLMSLQGGKHPTTKGSSKVSALSTESLQDGGFQSGDISADGGDITPQPRIGLTEAIEKEIPAVKQEVNEHNEIEGQGYEEAVREAEGKEQMERTSSLSNSDVGVTSKRKLEGKKMNSSKTAELNKPAIGSPKSRVKGMVKDFFKISNQESLSKAKANAGGRNLSSRWKTTSRNRSDKELGDGMPNLDAKVPAAFLEIMRDASNTKQLDSEVPAENVKTVPDASSTTGLDSKVPTDNVTAMPDASFVVEEHIERSNKQQFAWNRPIKKVTDVCFDRMDASPSSESTPYGSKYADEHIDDPSLENFQVEELSADQDKLSKIREQSEAIRALDSKIHLWSTGRKGNIRSLLSTLQLVLWPGSGWKPVALVDIIEANAVKKAYNRAMLCLHPDKLQQKGADLRQKYMAEKIFDILQEAWDHFNSLGTLI